MRIVAGSLRGRPLATPRDAAIRPTSDRVREAVFNILSHGLDAPPLEDAQIMDLFAGTGALGLEAISRGARYAIFVETDAEARGLIRRNVEAFGLTGNTRVLRRDATDLGPATTPGTISFAFLDPPYDQGLATKALAALAAGRWLADGAIAVIEERAGTDVPLPAGFMLLDERTWGDTTVRFARYSAETPAAI